MFQKKEQDKNQKEKLSEVETGNLPEKEFTVTVVEMTRDIGKRMEIQTKKTEEMFNKELEDLKNKQR